MKEGDENYFIYGGMCGLRMDTIAIIESIHMYKSGIKRLYVIDFRPSPIIFNKIQDLS